MGQGTALPPGAAYLLNGELIAVAAAVIVLWIVNVAITGWLAGRKGRNDDLWAVRAIFFGPIALIAILLRPPKVGPPDTELVLADATMGRVHLRSDSELEFDVAGRLARLRGVLAGRVNGQPAFRLARSAEWRWSDDDPMTDEDRERLRREITRAGKHDGWVLTLDANDR